MGLEGRGARGGAGPGRVSRQAPAGTRAAAHLAPDVLLAAVELQDVGGVLRGERVHRLRRCISAR